MYYYNIHNEDNSLTTCIREMQKSEPCIVLDEFRYITHEEFTCLKIELENMQKEIEDFRELIKELGFAKLMGGEM